MHRIPGILAVLLLALSTGACDLIGDLLEFGFWVIIIIVLLIVFAGWALAKRLGRGRRGPPPA